MNVRLGMRQLVSAWGARRCEVEDERYDDLWLSCRFRGSCGDGLGWSAG